MSAAVARVGAIVRTDFLIRFRRLSTLVVFLLLSSLAYVWIPAPSTGRALLQIGGKRALLNSAAIGMATASLASIFIGLVGFYVISNAIRSDVTSRCGFVLASTTMKKWEYVVGKFAGNLLFLTVFTAGFMICSMAMLLVRGEARLEPLLFMKQYLLLVPPGLVAVAAISILFESVPLLRSRLGDVGYFFVWIGTLALVPILTEETGDPGFARLFDFSGLGLLYESIRGGLGTNDVSIGASTFDPAKPVVVFAGLDPSATTMVWRVFATFTPLLFLVVAAFFFHRFDPARVKSTESKDVSRWLGRINLLFKPISRLAFAAVVRPGGASRIRTTVADTMLTLTSMPLALLAAIGFSIAAWRTPVAQMGGLTLVAFVAYAIVIADIACRETRAGVSALVMSMPHVREARVPWKLAVTLLTGVLFFAVPLYRLAQSRPTDALALAAGVLFVGSLATALGVVSSNPKTFLVLFLMYWYVVSSDKGGNPAIDFGGFHGHATPATIATFAAISVVAFVAAQAFHSWDLKRRW